MREGIAIVGLNGSGKSTLAHGLSNRMGYYEIDVEDYYFPEQKKSRMNALDNIVDEQPTYLGAIPYSVPRDKGYVEAAIRNEIDGHPKFIISGVTMNWDEEILSAIRVVFWLKTPDEVRLSRISAREEKRWGARVRNGGDMYEQQNSFRKRIAGLTDTKVLEGIKNLDCEVIELDGMQTVEQNIDSIIDYLKEG